MSYIHHDRNNEQMRVPITVIRGATSRSLDGLGGDSVLQSKAAIVSPSSRPDADVDYTFIQVFSGVAGRDDLQDEMNTDCPRRSVTQ